MLMVLLMLILFADFVPPMAFTTEPKAAQKYTHRQTFDRLKVLSVHPSTELEASRSAAGADARQRI